MLLIASVTLLEIAGWSSGAMRRGSGPLALHRTIEPRDAQLDGALHDHAQGCHFWHGGGGLSKVSPLPVTFRFALFY